MAEKDQFLKIEHPRRVSGRLKLVEFKDDGHYIAYCAALNLSGYGDSPSSALEMLLKVVLDDYFANLMNLPEQKAFDELKALGWKRDKLFKRKLHASAYVDREGILKDFNLSAETEIKETLIAV